MIIPSLALLIAIAALPKVEEDKVLALMANLPKTLEAAESVAAKIEDLDKEIPFPTALEEQDEPPADKRLRDQRRALLQQLKTLLTPVVEPLRVASKAYADQAAPFDQELREAIHDLDSFGDMIKQHEQVIREEDKARTQWKDREGPVLDPRAIAARAIKGNRAPVEAFLKTDPTRFVFSLLTFQEGRDKYWLEREVKKGEPMLIRRCGTEQCDLFTVDGLNVTLYETDLSTKPLSSSAHHPLKPEWLTIQDAKGYLGGPNDFEDDDTGFYFTYAGFLRALEPGDPRIERFVEQREKVIACYDAMMAKLDPDNRRGDWDLVHYGADGERKKVESLVSVYDRRACAKCGCKKFNKAKRELARAAIEPLQKAKYAEMKPAIDRVNELFKR